VERSRIAHVDGLDRAVYAGQLGYGVSCVDLREQLLTEPGGCAGRRLMLAHDSLGFAFRDLRASSLLEQRLHAARDEFDVYRDAMRRVSSLGPRELRFRQLAE
jgi:hypothetical protein